MGPTDNVVFKGQVRQTSLKEGKYRCCESMERSDAGWTYIPPSNNGTLPGAATCESGDMGKKDMAWEGTPIMSISMGSYCCTYAKSFGGDDGAPAYFSYSANGSCDIYQRVSGSRHVPGSSAGFVQAMPLGNCTYFKELSSRVHMQSAVSGICPVDPVDLWPAWPASSPFVTAVGATQFVNNKVGNAEMAPDNFGSGGGFSPLFSQSPHAEWQSGAVKDYLRSRPSDSHFPPEGSFPATGRATPDVSALGVAYQVLVNGSMTPISGTSASTPAFAAMVSLLNEARMQKGLPPMGLLNPFLYANPDAFTDITQGSNAFNSFGEPLAYGFNCSRGWDPATGLGTPLFAKLLSAAMNMWGHDQSLFV